MKLVKKVFGTIQENQVIQAGIFIILAILSFVNSNRLESRPMWFNMTDEAAANQVQRVIDEMSLACNEAGGEWIAGMTQSICSVPFQQPVMDWFIKPIANPDYLSGQIWWGFFTLVGGMFVGVAVMLIYQHITEKHD